MHIHAVSPVRAVGEEVMRLVGRTGLGAASVRAADAVVQRDPAQQLLSDNPPPSAEASERPIEYLTPSDRDRVGSVPRCVQDEDLGVAALT